MNLLPFENLPAYSPRRFVPQQIDLGDWKQIAPLFDLLETRAPQMGVGVSTNLLVPLAER